MNAFHVIIPARYESTRLPGKLLLPLGKHTVIERVYYQACQANPLSVIIATDSQEIADHVQSFGAEVCMTASTHMTGSDRIAEAAAKKGLTADEIIVNVQGDEPFIPPALIQQAATIVANNPYQVGTLCWPITQQEAFLNPNIVKVVYDKAGRALYFSRSPIPANRDDNKTAIIAQRHIGIYAYRARFLQQYVKWPLCALEQFEMLEMLRILWEGYSMGVEVACTTPQQDINTAEDWTKAQALVQSST